MDFKFNLTEDEKAFQAEVREFLDTYVSLTRCATTTATPATTSTSVHRALAEKGWLEKEIKGAEGWRRLSREWSPGSGIWNGARPSFPGSPGEPRS